MKTHALFAALALTVGAAAASTQEAADAIKNPVKQSPASAAKGKEFYDKSCVLCHGKTGDGKGAAAESLQAPIPGFADPKVTSATDGYLFSVIRNGSGWFEMPPYASVYRDEEIWHLVNHIRTLATKK